MGVLLDCPIGRSDPRICVGIAIAVLRNLRKCIPLLDAVILDLLLGRGVLPPHHLALAHLLDMPPPCTPPSASLRQRLPGRKVPPCRTADHRARPGCCPPLGTRGPVGPHDGLGAWTLAWASHLLCRWLRVLHARYSRVARGVWPARGTTARLWLSCGAATGAFPCWHGSAHPTRGIAFTHPRVVPRPQGSSRLGAW